MSAHVVPRLLACQRGQALCVVRLLQAQEGATTDSTKRLSHCNRSFLLELAIGRSGLSLMGPNLPGLLCLDSSAAGGI